MLTIIRKSSITENGHATDNKKTLIGLLLTGILVFAVMHGNNFGLGIIVIFIVVPALIVMLISRLIPKGLRPKTIDDKPRSTGSKTMRALLFWLVILIFGIPALFGFAYLMGYIPYP